LPSDFGFPIEVHAHEPGTRYVVPINSDAEHFPPDGELRGTIRDHVTKRRRRLVRFFACEQDLSHELPDTRLPDAVATGAERLWILGAMAGG
jgi:hypothetical protein